jgi:tetratricopeptide (TPR) repeat protein
MVSVEGLKGRAVWTVIVLSMVTSLWPICAHATGAVVLDPHQQFQFAESYFQRGDYYKAIGEFERFIYFFPEAEKVEHARYKIGLSYLKGEKYAEAIQAFQGVIERYVNSHYAIRSYFGISEANVRRKNYDAALITLANVVRISLDPDVKDEALYRCGWVYLDQGLWEEARRCFNKISPDNRDKYNIEQLMLEIDKEAHLRHKNPTTAGLLAILPGAGHVYTERYRDGLVSFLVNGALIFAAYQAFRHEQYALGGIITVVEVGFYAGNIYGAVNSAHKFNRNEEKHFLNYLKDHAKVNLSLQRPQDGGAILLSCKFPF